MSKCGRKLVLSSVDNWNIFFCSCNNYRHFLMDCCVYIDILKMSVRNVQNSGKSCHKIKENLKLLRKNESLENLWNLEQIKFETSLAKNISRTEVFFSKSAWLELLLSKRVLFRPEPKKKSIFRTTTWDGFWKAFLEAIFQTFFETVPWYRVNQGIFQKLLLCNFPTSEHPTNISTLNVHWCILKER